MKSSLGKNDTEMYSTHNEEKSVVAQIFTRNLKNKTYKYTIGLQYQNIYIY